MTRLVAERYRVLEKIGEGGMGEALAAYDEKLKRKVVLKSIRWDRQLDELSRARFRREAQILSQLDHPSICRIHDSLEEGDAEYLVLEFIDGVPLHLAMLRGIERERALDIAGRILDALEAAHAEGIVHRDLKPANVMLLANDEVKVLDFGLARLETVGANDPADDDAPAGDVETPADLGSRETISEAVSKAALESGSRVGTIALHTEVGTVSGTLMYMSPEQARGGEVGPPSDLYSFGLMMQELLTGKRPYPELDTLELWERVKEGRSDPIEGLDADLTQWLESLLVRAPAQRLTARDAGERLVWIRGSTGRLVRRAIAVAIALVVIGAAVKYTFDLRRERGIAEDERRIADKERGIAQEQRDVAVLDRKRAVALAEFMIGDLHDRLEQEGGRLDLLDASHEKVLEYFAAVDEADLTDDELMNRCNLLGRISATRARQGRWSEALAFSRESVAQAEALYERAPDDPERILNLSNSAFYLGFAHFELGQYDDCEAQYRRYLELASRLSELDPADRDARVEVAYAWTNLGGVHRETQSYSEAIDAFERALDVWAELASTAGSDETREEVAIEIADVQSWLGSTLIESGRPQDAVPILVAELETRTRVFGAAEGAPHPRERLAVCERWLGQALLDLGDDGAREHLDRSCSLLRDLVAHDDGNANWKVQLARVLLSLARAHRLASDDGAARTVSNEVRELLLDVPAGGEASPEWLALRAEADALSTATSRD